MDRKLKILLIHSPNTNEIKRGGCPVEIENFSKKYHPISLLYSVAKVRKDMKEDVEIKLLDFPATASEDYYKRKVKEKVEDFKPHIIGISSTTFTIYDAYEVAKIVKSISPKIKVVFGGTNASIYPDEMIIQPFIDFVVIGEGEETFYELIEKFDTPDMYFVNGTFSKKNGEIYKNPKRPPIKNLDEIPFPDRTLIEDESIYVSLIHLSERETVMLSSRGCPYSCAYCDPSASLYRWRSPENVVDEIEYVVDLGYNTINFSDDFMNINKKRLQEICKEIIRRKIKIRWKMRGGANTIDEETAELMREAGCIIAYIGIESANDKTLKNLNRKITTEQNLKAVKILKKYEIKVAGYFMIGLPEETEEDIKKTINFALKLPIDFVEANVLAPIPNTPLYNMLIKSGKIDDWYRKYTLSPWKKCYFKTYAEITGEIPVEKVFKLQKEFIIRFYLRPKIIIKIIMEILKEKKLGLLIKHIKFGLQMILWYFKKE